MYGLPGGGGAFMAMAAASSISPTDPRIQPFIKQAREETFNFRVKMLMSNGMSEAAARQEVERSMPADKNAFAGQGLLKYYSSLSGGGSDSAAAAYSPWGTSTMAMVSMHHQQQQQQQQSQSFTVQHSTPASASNSTNTALQQLLRGISSIAASKSFNTAASTTSSGVADVLASAQANASRTRMNRFDSPSATPKQSIPAASSTTPAPFFNHASYFPQMFNLQAQQRSYQAGTPANLEKSLQVWKYQVFSTHQNVPRGMQGKQWRSILNQYVKKREREVRDAHLPTMPPWLSSCWIPNVTEILTETGTSDSPVAPPTSSIPPAPIAPTASTLTGSLSPVSSSDESSRGSKAKKHDSHRHKRRRSCRSRSSSRSSMSKSSASESAVIGLRRNQQSALEARERRSQKRPRGDLESEDMIPLTLGGKRKKKKVDKKATSAEERKKRYERSRRFGLNDDSSMFIDTESGAALTTSEGLRMMTWQEKLAMLASVDRVVGQSQLLEKPYLRLCGPPDPALVRPENVLVRSFRHCVDKWEKEKNYRFIEEQFRSIRQDMTVQGIRNDFTIEVYETNARIALENSDLGQFNQCQTQLRELHKSLNVAVQGSHREEFLCYHLLYLSLMNMRHDLLKLSGELTNEEKELAGVIYAVAFRRALVEGNLHRALKLSAKGPFLSSTLIRIFLNRLRLSYLVLISRAHYAASIEFLKKELLFSTEAECEKFLFDSKAIWADEQRQSVDCRKSLSIFEQSSLLQSRKIKALG